MSLSKIQQSILDFIASELATGRSSPSHREIAKHLGFKSSFAAGYHVRALAKKRLIDADFHKARSITLAGPKRKPQTFEIPVFGSIPAGLGEDREQESDTCISVDIEAIGFKPTKYTFALRVSGDSMIGRHICSGDIVVMEHGPEPRNGDIVAALIDGKSTLKTFLTKGRKSFLRAENPRYPNLIPSEELMIQGVFRALIRKAKA